MLSQGIRIKIQLNKGKTVRNRAAQQACGCRYNRAKKEENMETQKYAAEKGNISAICGGARVWEEELLIPTYEIGEAEKNPIFLDKRVYQGEYRQGVSLSYCGKDKRRKEGQGVQSSVAGE